MGAGDVFAFLGWYSKTLSVFTFWSSRPKTQKHHVPAIGLLLVETSVMRFCVFAFLGPIIRTGLIYFLKARQPIQLLSLDKEYLEDAISSYAFTHSIAVRS